MPVGADTPGLTFLAEQLRGDEADRRALRQWLTDSAQSIGADEAVLGEEPRDGGHDGEVVWMLGGWAIAEKHLPDGRRQGLDVLLPGDIHVDDYQDDNVPSRAPTVLRTLTEAVVSRQSRDLVAAAGESVPRLTGLLEQRRRERDDRMAERLLRVGQTDGAARLLYTLLDFAARLRPVGGLSAAGEFRMPLNQTTLGELNGLSNVHVCRLLGQMEKDGLVAVDGENVRLDVRRAQGWLTPGNPPARAAAGTGDDDDARRP